MQRLAWTLNLGNSCICDKCRARTFRPQMFWPRTFRSRTFRPWKMPQMDVSAFQPEFVVMNALFALKAWYLSFWRKNQQSECVPSESSDQPGHPPSLIRVIAVHMMKAWTLRYTLSAQQRLWSDWTDAQADLSLRWAHSHFVGFVMLWLFFVGSISSVIWWISLRPEITIYLNLIRKKKFTRQDLQILCGPKPISKSYLRLKHLLKISLKYTHLIHSYLSDLSEDKFKIVTINELNKCRI